uniref:Peptidase M1 membrane alanine aminopeptidase domain-containing protein n=1 Tax=Panagrolaimus sp. PS1159 TaxID=55785 RepID=A0AC35FS19_9BILA
MSWWNDIWLSESITSFLSTQRPIVFDSNTDLTSDALVNDLWADNIPQISYTKGAAILEMLDSVIGTNRMRKVLRDYVRNYQFGIATTANFLNILKDVTKDLPFDTVEFFSSWLYQGSHPIIFIDYDKEMKRFILSQTPKMGPRNIQWKIPIWIDCIVGTKRETLYWIPKNQQLILDLQNLTTSDSKDAVAFNRNKAVYYQISYRYK